MQEAGHSIAAGSGRTRAPLDLRAARHARAYRCRCGSRVFFRNTQCLACHSVLAYVPDEGRMAALDPGPEPRTWIADGLAGVQRYCANHDAPAVCNWLADVHDNHDLCIACQLNRTIPDLADADNARYWAKLEIAKRRVVSELLALGLPVLSKVDRDPAHGLMFDFLRSPTGGPQVLTGHASGLVTINVEEADDAKREHMKFQLREPYRTLLGHFRHEIGHYYWDRLVLGTPWLEPFRALFGDERASYAEALARNYEQGPPAGWEASHVSAYAATHPWEDWAETWAHYLHLVDSLGTALGFGIDPDALLCDITPFTREDLYAPHDPEADELLALLNGWIEIAVLMNELARSMGVADFYPFVMSKPVVRKLHLIHMIVTDARRHAAARVQTSPSS